MDYWTGRKLSIIVKKNEEEEEEEEEVGWRVCFVIRHWEFAIKYRLPKCHLSWSKVSTMQNIFTNATWGPSPEVLKNDRSMIQEKIKAANKLEIKKETPLASKQAPSDEQSKSQNFTNGINKPICFIRWAWHEIFGRNTDGEWRSDKISDQRRDDSLGKENNVIIFVSQSFVEFLN